MSLETASLESEAPILPDPVPAKVSALDVLDVLPETASWDRILYELSLREAIWVGIEDTRAGRVVSDEELGALCGLDDH